MRALFRYLLALAALLAIWQIGSLALGEFLLPRPLDVLAYFGEALTTGAFWQHAGASAWRVLSAMSLAWLVAFPLGLILGHVRSVDNTLSPMVFLTYPLPKIVLLPLFLTLFGLGDLPRVLLIALTTGYQILVVTRASAQGLDKKYLDSFRSLGGTPLQMLRHVLIPAALPDAMTALKVASGTAVAVLFMAESFATRRGLGFLIMDAWGRGDQLEMFTGILAMSLLGVALYELCNVLETRSCRTWRGNADDACGNALRGGWRGAWRAVPPRCFALVRRPLRQSLPLRDAARQRLRFAAHGPAGRMLAAMGNAFRVRAVRRGWIPRRADHLLHLLNGYPRRFPCRASRQGNAQHRAEYNVMPHRHGCGLFSHCPVTGITP